MAKVATDFDKIINESRERNKNEALAARIFGNKDRRSSVPLRSASQSPGPSLASRVGIKKRVSSSLGPRDILPAQRQQHNVGAAAFNSGSNSGSNNYNHNNNSLANRVGNAGVLRKQRRAAQVAGALIKSELGVNSSPAQHAASSQLHGAAAGQGLSIRGLAGPKGPFAVMMQNFAPGTTAADIESAVTPVGGPCISCRIIKERPIVIAEMEFADRGMAERVVSTFDEQMADGRSLRVYHKNEGGDLISSPAFQKKPIPTGPRAQQQGQNSVVIDGSLGFDDPMEVDAGSANRVNGNTRRQGGSGLYSDQMVGRARRGRGSYRGGRNPR